MRSRHTLRNSLIGLLAVTLTTILAFFARSTVADVLGQEAIGLIALFTDLYIVLNFFRFGIQPSFLTALYKPVSTGDAPRIQGIYRWYRKVYRLLGLVFLGASVALALLLCSLYTDQVGLYFFLIAFNYVLIFFFSYPVLLAEANQEFFYLTNLFIVSQGLMALLRIILLPLFPSFYIYILAHFLSTVAYLVSVHLLVHRAGLIPDSKRSLLDSGVKESVKRRMVGYSFHNVENVIVSGLNNVYVAAFGGLTMTASFGSYGMIIVTLTRFSNMVVQNMTASVGNLLAEEDEGRNEEVYQALLFLYSAVGTAVALGFLNIADLFMRFWLGESYVLGVGVRYGFAALFLLQTMLRPTEIFKQVKGVMFHDRYVPIVSGMLNVILCLVLGYRYGPEGILAANLLSLLAISFWQKPLMVFRHVLHRPLTRFFRQMLPYLAVSMLAGLISVFCCRLIHLPGQFLPMIFNGSVSVLSAIILYALFFFHSGPCQYILGSINNVWKKQT